MAKPAIRFTEVSRTFGEVTAVDRVSLDIQDGEFFTLLGPSGSGKTTCLRLIGGFEQPSSGSIELHGVEASGLPPYARDVNTVFQDYALFPHMTVFENVAYGLRVKKVPRQEIASRVEEMLAMVRLPGLGGRKPAQLSGGQRQRVALARALVNRPRALLLDEPLAALDRKLRHEMQSELKALQAKVGITFVLVTHDQDEALSMSDRLAVFDKGRVQQVGTPSEVYDKPRTAFVAGFVGISNVVDGAAVRPEKIRVLSAGAPVPEGCASVEGTIAEVIYLGPQTRYEVTIAEGQALTVVRQNLEPAHPRGEKVRLVWSREHAHPLEG